MSNNNQYLGFKEPRTLFGILGIAIQKTLISIKPKECSRKRKSRTLIKAKATRLLKLSGKNNDYHELFSVRVP